MAIGNPCPKHKPRDKAVIDKLKREITYCEICGSPRNLEAAHIISKGAGGPDMRENIVIICGPAALQQGCHGQDHLGLIKKDELFKVAAKREGITPAECRKRVRRKMGYDV